MSRLAKAVKNASASIESNGSRLRLAAGERKDFGVNGHYFTLHPKWLRERCNSEEMMCQQSKMGLVDPQNIDRHLTIKDASVNDISDELNVTFSDNHKTTLNLSKIFQELNDFTSTGIQLQHTTLPKQILKKDFEMPHFYYDEDMYSSNLPSKVFETLLQFGCVLIRDGPKHETFLNEFVQNLSLVEHNSLQTLGTKMFKFPADDRVGEDIAFLPDAIPPHTDQPYADPIPSIELFHCVENGPREGVVDDDPNNDGSSIIVDGFAAAEKLYREDKELFDVLTETPVRWELGTEYYCIEYKPIIQLDNERLTLSPEINGDGIQNYMKSIHWSTKSGGYSPALDDISKMDAFYDAKYKFGSYINGGEFTYNLVPKPGDFWIISNRRMLHARKAFNPNKRKRSLRACYVTASSIQNVYLKSKNKL